MCEIDADIVFHEFSTKASPGDSLESKKFKKENVFIFSCRLWHGSRVVILKIEKSQYITCF